MTTLNVPTRRQYDMASHPTPWKVSYWQRCPEWDRHSGPHIVDAKGDLVCELPVNVGHPGDYDAIADETAYRIVEAVNDNPSE